MTGWTTHRGTALAFDRESVDTDQLIPARFMSTPRAEGYGRFLMHDLRHDAQGAPLPDFPLNRHPKATVLVAGRNFGSGSSREAAVYALVDAGFRAVIAPSFGDIFAANAVNNGLLPARVPHDALASLTALLGQDTLPVTIDLAEMVVTIGQTALSFDLDPIWREKIIKGWDDIDLTAHYKNEIAAYRDAMTAREAWRIPAQTG